MEKTIGIDFGATNASVAIWERNQAQVLANSEGFEATPALVAELPDGRRIVGQVVLRQMVIHAETSIGNLQGWLGRRFEHPQTAADAGDAAYGVAASPRGDAWIELCGHAVPPAELAATLMAYLKDLAQDYLGNTVQKVVVAVPASFHAAARQALLDAGRLAEFDEVHIVSSAAAAALAYARQLHAAKAAKSAEAAAEAAKAAEAEAEAAAQAEKTANEAPVLDSPQGEADASAAAADDTADDTADDAADDTLEALDAAAADEAAQDQPDPEALLEAQGEASEDAAPDVTDAEVPPQGDSEAPSDAEALAQAQVPAVQALEVQSPEAPEAPETLKVHTLAIFDWGGGACQVAIVDVQADCCEVLTTCTDQHCGGNKIDWALAEHLASEFSAQEHIDLRKDAIGWQRVLQAAQEIKRVLAEESSYDVNLPFIAADSDGAKHLAVTITRDMFEALATPWVKRCRALCEQALEESGKSAKGINATLLVGGMTHHPMVKSMVRKALGKKPLAAGDNMHPQQVVARGAVLWGAMLQNNIAKINVLDGLGADICLVAGAQRITLWARGTALPADAQICVQVPEGAQEQSWDVVQDADDQPIARISLPAMGAGDVEVKAALSAEGLITVKARDLRCRPAMAATVALFGGLTAAETDQIFARAEARRQEDPVSESLEQLRRTAEGLVTNIESALEERSKELTQVDLADITGALNNLKHALDGADRSAIEDTYAVLHASTQAMGELEQVATSS